jgi:hypothetical protein
LAEAALGARIASFGFAPSATYRIEAARSLDAGTQELTMRGIRFHLPRPGRANAQNAAAALAVAAESGGDLARAAAALAGAIFTGQRSAWVRLGGVDVLDDTYNANPDSMAQAVELLAARPGRRIAVLGDMLELGSESAALHAGLGTQVAQAGIDLVVRLRAGHGARGAPRATGAERAPLPASSRWSQHCKTWSHPAIPFSSRVRVAADGARRHRARGGSGECSSWLLCLAHEQVPLNSTSSAITLAPRTRW